MTKKQYSWCYIGTNDNNEHYGNLTDLSMLRRSFSYTRRSSLPGVRRIITHAGSKSDLWEKVQNYVANIPGNFERTLWTGQIQHTITRGSK